MMLAADGVVILASYSTLPYSYHQYPYAGSNHFNTNVQRKLLWKSKNPFNPDNETKLEKNLLLSEEDIQGSEPIHEIKQIEEDLISTYMCEGNHCERTENPFNPQDEVKFREEEYDVLRRQTRI